METDALIRFVLARITADRLEVSQVTRPWLDSTAALERMLNLLPADAAHIVKWSPQRVMAEIDLKQALAIRCQQVLNDPDYNGTNLSTICQEVLTLMAMVYEDHEDFLEEWDTVPEEDQREDVPNVVWFRVSSLPYPEYRAADADWRPAKVHPEQYAAGDLVTVRDPEGALWKGIVTTSTEDHVAIRPLEGQVPVE
jgi:hypothetical protein